MRRSYIICVHVILMIMAFLLSVSSTSAEWQFSGARLEDDFNGPLFGGWASTLTTEKMAAPGDYFLGPAVASNVTLMDFVDDLNGEIRLVDISFDSIHASTGFQQSLPLTVTLNGDSYVSALRNASPARYGVVVSSQQINLEQNGNSGSGCCRDLEIGFATASGGSFGLDNLVVDWSQVPEPASLGMLAMATLLAAVWRFKC